MAQGYLKEPRFKPDNLTPESMFSPTDLHYSDVCWGPLQYRGSPSFTNDSNPCWFDHSLLKQYPFSSNRTIWAQTWNVLITLPWELINTGIYLHDPLDMNEFIHSVNQQIHIKYLLCINSYIRTQMVPAFMHLCLPHSKCWFLGFRKAQKMV